MWDGPRYDVCGATYALLLMINRRVYVPVIDSKPLRAYGMQVGTGTKWLWGKRRWIRLLTSIKMRRELCFVVSGLEDGVVELNAR